MKVLNLNLHFYPESIGGATVVAEKLAWGLVQQGHEVTNVFLGLRPGNADFTTQSTPFGRSIGIRNIPHSPSSRFFSPPAASALKELIELVHPDRIFVHAVQHMGIHEVLSDPALREKTTVIAHDAFWMCLQGFRVLPDGSPCNRELNTANCRQCAWFPGLTDNIYSTSRRVLSECRAVVFPSVFLEQSYTALFGSTLPGNFVVQSNPDVAETIIPDALMLPPPAGSAARAAGKKVFGFVGGPGETKGWSLVRAFMERAKESHDEPGGVHVVLFDIGRSTGAPWYPGLQQPGVTIADPFHWSFAGHALSALDVMLMPSRVRESFGLAAREILSLGGGCIIRPSGALAELQGHKGVVVADHDDDDDVDSLLAALAASHDKQRTVWRSTSIDAYVAKLLSV